LFFDSPACFLIIRALFDYPRAFSILLRASITHLRSFSFHATPLSFSPSVRRAARSATGVLPPSFHTHTGCALCASAKKESIDSVVRNAVDGFSFRGGGLS